MSYQDLKILEFKPSYVHKQIIEIILEMEADPEQQMILLQEYCEKYYDKIGFEDVRVSRKERK